MYACRAPLDSTSYAHRQSIFIPENNNLRPHTLSMDWLNNKLYILFEVEVGVKHFSSIKIYFLIKKKKHKK